MFVWLERRLNHILDFLLRLAVFPSIVGIQNRSLFGCSVGESSVDTPGTFVIDNVGTNFTDLFGSTAEVGPVILDLEVLAQGDEDVRRNGERIFGRVGDRFDPRDVKGKGDGEVEGVVGGFVNDDKTMPKVTCYQRRDVLE